MNYCIGFTYTYFCTSLDLDLRDLKLDKKGTNGQSGRLASVNFLSNFFFLLTSSEENIFSFLTISKFLDLFKKFLHDV